jgi:conserved domain protein
VYNKYEKYDKSYSEAKMKGPKGKFAWTATVGERGQIVIPKQARELFGIKPGDTLLLLGDTKRGIAIPPSGSFTSLLERVFADGEHEENESLAAAETETESAEASYADGANANNEADCSDGNGGAI